MSATSDAACSRQAANHADNHFVQAHHAATADLSFAQQDTWACEQQGQQFKISVSINPQRALWKLFALG